MVDMDLDDPCYVFGFELDGEGGASDVVNGGCHVWVHIDYSESTAENWLRTLGLEEWVVSTLIRPDTRPRTVLSKAGTLVVLRGINANPDSEPEDMVSLRVWIEQDRIITVRQRKLFSIQEVKKELETGIGPKDLNELVARVTERIGDRIASYVDLTEEQLERLEVEVESGRNSRTRSIVSETRRSIASVRRFLAPQRDALESLYRHAVSGSDSLYAFAIREQSDRMIRYLEDLDLVRERLLVLQEDLMNFMMEEQNSRMYALSIVAVIFLPITFVSGLFGMNVAGLPGVSDPNAFNFVMFGMVAISAVVIALLVIKKWL